MHPETLVEGKLRQVVVAVPAKESLHSCRVLYSHDGRVVVQLQAALLGIDPCRIGLILESCRELTRSDVFAHVVWRVHQILTRHRSTIHLLEEEFSCPFCPFPAESCDQMHSVLPLSIPLQEHTLHVGHVVHSRPLERGEHVVLVRLDETVAGSDDIIEIGGCNVVLGELARQVVLLVDGIGDFPQSLPTLVAKAITDIPLAKPMGIQVGCRLCAGSQLQALHEVL